MSGWRFWIDRGGTFTDVIGVSATGLLATAKLLSDNPASYPDAATAGIRQVLGLPLTAPIPAGLVREVRMGTTVATNALLTRSGARTLLVVNEGFRDLLRIGHQARPELFALEVRLPAPLYEAVEEVGGRLGVDGELLTPLDEAAVAAMLARRRAAGLTSCAIALMHAWRHPGIERRVAALARAAGFEWVSASHEVSPSVGLVSRAATTVVDAYVSPVLTRYVRQVAADLGDIPLQFMQSSGGLAAACDFTGKDAILSGPAGGVVGAVRTAEAAGEGRIIAFDMGGTSTDISLYEGRLERTFDTAVAGVQMRVPMMAVTTVAAGGGSILRFDGARFRVGPESAGAHPGPAAYRRGGPLTVTDANVMLGKIIPEHFPAVFGRGGDEPLDRAIVGQKFAQLARETGQREPREVAEGFVRIAVAGMAAAIKRLALERGRDVAELTLQCFGGAAGQHACLVAAELGMRRVLIHPLAGVLSAYGIGLAEQSVMRQMACELPLAETAAEALTGHAQRLRQESTAALADAGRPLRTQLTAQLRYQGTDTALPVTFGAIAAMREDFERSHRERFGFTYPGRPVTVATLVAEAIRPGETLMPVPPAAAAAAAHPDIEMWSGGAAHRAQVHERAGLAPGRRVTGPALICEALATTVVEPGWSAQVLPGGELLLTSIAPVRRTRADPARADPVHLELFSSLFMGVAEQMGAQLRSTSTSVNIRERLDYSCAVFDARGGLVANAPHVPVHLGSMGESVRTVLAQRGAGLRPGSAVLLNNPYNGGTHLPDVTVVTPVFDAAGTQLRFFVANRGHHADIGGITPGSMPAGSRTLAEEGVVIDDFLLLEGGVLRERELRQLLTAGPHPARSPEVNIADIRAQLAANEAGVRELARLVTAHGWDVVQAYMGHVMANAEESVRRVIDRLTSGAMQYPMDDGAVLAVQVRVDHAARQAQIDFTGTSAQRPGNFNAPPSITRAAVLYVFRCLVGDDIPLNEGCLAPLAIITPAGSFLAPTPGCAVVAGNTEVSQAVCNALLGAMGVAASSQATMNNVTWGNERHQYYETICGGTGAGPGFAGADAVHSHTTNTRITDAEVLELRYPVRLERFGVRPDSGGRGRWNGGDGAIRAIRVLTPMTATVVGSRRTVPPFGLAGGGPGAPGTQRVERADGSVQILKGTDQVELGALDLLVIETPGGGGYGPPR